MITILSAAILGLSFSVQNPEAVRSDLVVVSGLASSKDFPPRALDLGHGGFGGDHEAAGEQAPAARRTATPQPGVVSWTSPGGALVRVAAAGVKVDLPTGAELMVDPRGRVHLRVDGLATLPANRGLDLVLADGSRIVIQPSSNRRGQSALKSVVVEAVPGEQGQVLWQSSRQVGSTASPANHRKRGRRAPTRRWRSTIEFYVLGNGGDVLYEVSRDGPLVTCSRALCAPGVRHKYPQKRTVVLGDPLARSLRELPRLLPTKSTEYPEGPKTASALAQVSSLLFPRGFQRQPKGTVGENIVPLGDGGMRLSVAPGQNGMRFIRLTTQHASLPVAEWIIGQTARLQLVRQDGSAPGRPRYFQRSVPVVVE